MKADNDSASGKDEISSDVIFACFVSGAKFGMVVAALTLFVSLWSTT